VEISFIGGGNPSAQRKPPQKVKNGGGNSIRATSACGICKKIVLLSLIKHDLHVHFAESSNYIRGRRDRGIYNHSYIVEISFIGGGNPSAQRKPPTSCKSLTNFIR
jgi:hypothetical protein